MINSLRPLLADCPVVLQQKWHWEHLSMLPDNAHKCEICQTQYVNNHNCTGWGHVQANPTEMLLDDSGVSGSQRCDQRCDSSQMLSGEEEEKLKGWQEARMPHDQLNVPPRQRTGWEKQRLKVKLQPLINTCIRRGEKKQKHRSWKRGKDCRKVCNSRNLEVGREQGKKNPIKTSWGADEEPR